VPCPGPGLCEGMSWWAAAGTGAALLLGSRLQPVRSSSSTPAAVADLTSDLFR
jgi:hypothetical protein